MHNGKLYQYVILLLMLSPFSYAASTVTNSQPSNNERLAATQVTLTDKVNINTADAATFVAKLKGVGEKKAQAIIEYREKYGLFTDIKQLREVPGFGENLVSQILAHLTL